MFWCCGLSKSLCPLRICVILYYLYRTWKTQVQGVRNIINAKHMWEPIPLGCMAWTKKAGVFQSSCDVLNKVTSKIKRGSPTAPTAALETLISSSSRASEPSSVSPPVLQSLKVPRTHSESKVTLFSWISSLHTLEMFASTPWSWLQDQYNFFSNWT